MMFGPDNFLTHIKALIMGGGRDSNGNPANDAGFLKTAAGVNLRTLTASTITPLTFNLVAGTANNALQALADGSTYANDVAAIRNNFADLASKLAEVTTLLGGTADETNARVLLVEEAVDTIGFISFKVPHDYDEATDELRLRVLASQLSVSTDDDVELDAEVYIKTPGSALGADVGPAKPGTVLSTTEQYVEFDFSSLGLSADDVVQIKIITNGANDTNGEEILLHAVELKYRSTLVSYDAEDASGNPLR